MNESEFRDWSRAALSQFDERLKKVEARPVARERKPSDLELKGDMAELAHELSEGIRQGKVTGLAIAYLSEGQVASTAYATAAEHYALMGAVELLGFRILDGLIKGNEADEALGGGAAG